MSLCCHFTNKNKSKMSVNKLESFVIEILNEKKSMKDEVAEENRRCRVCLTTNADFIEILGKRGLEINLNSKLQQHLHINVDINFSSWPMSVCIKCAMKLEDFDQLYIMARQSEQKLLVSIEEEQPAFDQLLTEPDEFKASTDLSQDTTTDDLTESIYVEKSMESDYEAEDDSMPKDEEDVEDNMEEVEDDEEEEEDEEFTFKPSTKGTTSKRRGAKNLARQKEVDDQLIRETINLQCNDCNHIPYTFEDLLVHYRAAHKKVGVLNCCDKQFKRRFKLLEHVRLHINPDEFACTLCKKQFNSKYYLNDHMAIHIPEDQREFQCDKCLKRYPTKARLLTHIKSHNEELNFKCHHCDKAFNQKIVLYSHIKYVHEQTRTHICEVCAKVFKTKEAFISHQANHLEKRPPKLTCEICGGKYKNRDTLNQHLLRHKRAHERYECDLCGKIFNCKKRMAAHRKYVHATVKLKCNFCEKEFKRPICLKEHMASHTGQVLYTCAFCPKNFNSNANKYSHQKAQHPVEWGMAVRKKMEES